MARTKKAARRFNKQKQHKDKLASKGAPAAAGGVKKPSAGPKKGPKKGFKNKRQHGKQEVLKAGDAHKPAKGKSVEDLNVDEFLSGGFEDFEDDDASGSEDGVEELDDDSDDLDEIEGGSEDGDEDDGDDVDNYEEGAGEEVSGGESEEEEEAAKAGDPVAKDNKRLKGEISKHKSQLEALKEKDPEFYAYLQQTDAELLGFGEGEEDEDEEDEDMEEADDDEDEEEQQEDKAAAKDKKKKQKEQQQEEEEEEEGEAEDDKAGPSGRIDVTTAVVQRWCAAALGKGGKGPSLGAVRNLVKAYRLACHYGDPEAEAEAGGKLVITSSSVYNQLMMFMLKEADGIFRQLLGVTGKTDAALAADIAKGARWRKVGPLVKSFWGNSLALLGSITDAPLLAFTLRRLRASVAMLAPFAKLRDKFIKACLGIFGSADVAPRLQAFLAIRAVAATLPQPALDNCLKGVYKTYVANAKFVSAASAPHIAFMATCCVELWGLDVQASYQHAFSAIRQLALLLRSALAMKSADSYKQVYCWQTVNCMELWAKILGAHSDKAELKPLAYPLVQVVLGAARLVPTARYFPLRLRLVRALNRLAGQSGALIPVAPLLLEVLGWSDLRKSAKSSVSSGLPDLTLALRVGKTLLRSPAYQEEVVSQVMELLAEHLAQWSCSVAFPEMAHVPLLGLKRFAKTCGVDRFKRAARQLAESVQRNAAWVGQQRDRADFAPKDVSKVQAFLKEEYAGGRSPLQQYSKQLMEKAAQRAALRATEEVKVGKKRKAGGDDDDSDDFGSDGGADEDDDEVDEDDSDDLAAGDNDDEDDDDDHDEDEDEDEEEERPAKGAKAAKRPAPPTSDDDDDDDGEVLDMDEGEDVLEDYQLSDDDNEEDDDDDNGGDDDDDDQDDEAAAPAKRGGKPQPKAANGAVGKKQTQQQQQQQRGGKHKPQQGGKQGGGGERKGKQMGAGNKKHRKN